jgi:23S rRNA G2445 N2-methylase RlmL
MLTFKRKSRILITCAKGIAPFLTDELRSLNFPIITEREAGVETEGLLDDCMRLNLHIRTGHRVLFLLKEFKAGTPDDLYANLVKLEWEDYIDPGEYLCVTSAVRTASIQDTRFANLRCKDAIVDRLKKKCGRRPDSGPEKSGVVVYLYWNDEQCGIFLDTSGESLSKRGYRKMAFKAPMQETLAAATIIATGWCGDGSFINPMCGSGTLAIEAALIGLGRAPGSLRGNYGFMHLRGFDKSQWDALRKGARTGIRKSLPGQIIATDIDREAIFAARSNARTAGVEHLIEFSACDYSQTPVPAEGGVVFLNPEYGERMGEEQALANTYKGIGDFFKQKCQGYKGYVFTGNLSLAKRIGLKTNRRLIFYNSTIECRLLEYELYQGSKKNPSSGV